MCQFRHIWVKKWKFCQCCHRSIYKTQFNIHSHLYHLVGIQRAKLQNCIHEKILIYIINHTIDQSIKISINTVHTHTHTHPFNGPSSETTRVSRYQKSKPIWILLKQETASGSGIRWVDMQVCTSLQTDNHASTPPLEFFYRSDALPATQPTASKH